MSLSSLACSLFILTPILSVYGQQQSTKGLKLTMHRSVNKDSFYVAYHNNQNAWDAAFAFLKNVNLEELKPGKYPIIGEQVFAIVTEGPAHNKDSVKWESHKHYVDLHYVIKGKEMIGIADTAKATMIKPYTPDVINYTAEGKFYVAKPGEFFLFFPNDAHRPDIKLDGYDIVKKMVIKIATGY
jgi:biofilm protein TabA